MIAHLANVYDSTLKYWLAAQISLKALNLPNDDAIRAYWEEIERQREKFDARAEKEIKARFNRESDYARYLMQQYGKKDADELLEGAADDWFRILRRTHRAVATEFAKRTDEQLNPEKSRAVLFTATTDRLTAKDATSDLSDMAVDGEDADYPVAPKGLKPIAARKTVRKPR